MPIPLGPLVHAANRGYNRYSDAKREDLAEQRRREQEDEDRRRKHALEMAMLDLSQGRFDLQKSQFQHGVDTAENAEARARAEAERQAELHGERETPEQARQRDLEAEKDRIWTTAEAYAHYRQNNQGGTGGGRGSGVGPDGQPLYGPYLPYDEWVQESNSLVEAAISAAGRNPSRQEILFYAEQLKNAPDARPQWRGMDEASISAAITRYYTEHGGPQGRGGALYQPRGSKPIEVPDPGPTRENAEAQGLDPDSMGLPAGPGATPYPDSSLNIGTDTLNPYLQDLDDRLDSLMQNMSNPYRGY